MKTEERIVRAGANGTLIGESCEKLTPPDGWAFLPAGDAAITRKVKALSGFWRVQPQIGRRIISKGIWAPATLIEQTRLEVETLRTTDAYKNKLANDRMRTGIYSCGPRLSCLCPKICTNGTAIAEAVTTHAIPVGSGTVVRTAMIPIEERAAKDLIAWMRHKTTAYDSMSIARIKGERREVRRMLARRSVELLRNYRAGHEPGPDCPLQRVPRKSEHVETPSVS